VTEKPRGSRQRKSEPDTGSEPPHTSQTGSESSAERDREFFEKVSSLTEDEVRPFLESMSEEEIEYLQRRKFTWQEGDLEVVYDPYADERKKRGQRP
jgi:hypothetical protein